MDTKTNGGKKKPYIFENELLLMVFIKSYLHVTYLFIFYLFILIMRSNIITL